MRYEIQIAQHVAGDSPNTAYPDTAYMWLGQPYDEMIYIKPHTPPQEVTKATLRLYDHYGRIPNNQSISYETILNDWTSAITYNTQPSLSETYTQYPVVDGQWVELDITHIVNE